MVKASRSGLRWNEFEVRHLLREFYSGERVASIAKRHLRPELAIRSKLLRLGVANPILAEYQVWSRVSGEPLLSDADLGIGLNGFRKYPRQHFAWTKTEINLLSEAYKGGYSVTELGIIHGRYPLSILFPIYNYCDDGLFEEKSESGGERELRIEREDDYEAFLCKLGGGLGTLGCGPGYRRAEEVAAVARHDDFREWLGPDLDDGYGEAFTTDDNQSVEWHVGWGERINDYGAEYWDVYMGGPEDSPTYSTDCQEWDDADDYGYEETQEDDCEDKAKGVSEGKYKQSQVISFQSRYANTVLGAVCERQITGTYVLIEVFGSSEISTDLRGRVFSTVSEIKCKLASLTGR